MEKINQRKLEREFQKALAIEYVRDYCKKNNLSVEKLQQQRFILVCDECAFAFEEPSNIKPDQLVIDGGMRPKVTLIIKYKKGKLQIEETEYTKILLSIQ